jgi:hypothetical protein
MGYETHVIERIRLVDDGSLASRDNVESVRWWITRLQGERTNAEFIMTLPQHSGALLWMHAIPVELALAAEQQAAVARESESSASS